MKKKFLILSTLAAAMVSAFAAKTVKEPVVMTVNGKDVSRSEFEYLYNKNNSQQLAPQTLDEYVDMFVVYKLKVADAEAAGLDKTDEFRKEFDGYCDELSKPYLRDSLVEERLAKEAYERSKHIRLASHILLPMGKSYDEREKNRKLLDSIRTEILSGRADFAEMARKYSSDQSAETNGGSMGWFTINRFPYPFEKAVFDTPVGEISGVIDDAPYGMHIIRVEGEKPNPGKVEARHILKLTQGLSEEEAAVKKAQIDSIYSLLMEGADFSEIATKESEDPGSAIAGGKLGVFGLGRMVKEFEDAAFSLNDGEISKPFSTAYGYHIVQTLAHHDMDSYEEALPAIRNIISRDVRSRFPEREILDRFCKDYGVRIDTAAILSFKPQMDAAAGSAVAFESLSGNNTIIAKIGPKTITLSEVIGSIPKNTKYGDQDPFTTLYQESFTYVNDEILNAFKDNLYATESDYHNLVDEYRDGILLYEISNRYVWEKSAKDTDGLENFFKRNRDKYVWTKPYYKGCVIFATSDSIAQAAQEYLKANTLELDSVAPKLRENFGRMNIKVERVVTGKGDNAIVDNVAFGGERPAAPGKWLAWFSYDGRVIDQPEEAADVRGSVTSDYQQELERAWVEQLRHKYKVKFNKKEIDKISR